MYMYGPEEFRKAVEYELKTATPHGNVLAQNPNIQPIIQAAWGQHAGKTRQDPDVLGKMLGKSIQSGSATDEDIQAMASAIHAIGQVTSKTDISDDHDQPVPPCH